MAIDYADIQQAIKAFSALQHVRFNPQSLVEDVLLLSKSFPEQALFQLACANTARSLVQLSQGRVTGAHLKRELKDWYSYHYQPKVSQKEPASCRIVYRKTDEGIDVLGFGHRYIPKDIYSRMDFVARKANAGS